MFRLNSWMYRQYTWETICICFPGDRFVWFWFQCVSRNDVICRSVSAGTSTQNCNTIWPIVFNPGRQGKYNCVSSHIYWVKHWNIGLQKLSIFFVWCICMSYIGSLCKYTCANWCQCPSHGNGASYEGSHCTYFCRCRTICHVKIRGMLRFYNHDFNRHAHVQILLAYIFSPSIYSSENGVLWWIYGVACWSARANGNFHLLCGHLLWISRRSYTINICRSVRSDKSQHLSPHISGLTVYYLAKCKF